MNDTGRKLIRISKLLVFQGSVLTFLSLSSGCVLQPDANGSEGSESALSGEREAGAKAASEQPTRQPGIPKGCSQVWEAILHDWVLECPELAPPKPL